ncbi:MAG: porin [Planctomycetes bacterium]|nr:porin [Planctomycetota bacterium]
MIKRIAVVSVLWILLVLCLSARAEEPAGEEVRKLKEKVDSLEGRVKELESEKEKPPAAAADAEGGKNSLIDKVLNKESIEKALGLRFGGSVDTIYTWNFGQPADGRNAQRVFDARDNSFGLNLAELYIERPADKPGTAGFRVDLDFGLDPQVFQAAGFNDGDNFELEQAYVVWNAPLGNGLVIKAGKFTSMHGYEVIESVDNMNTSRSILFGYAVPGTHTGIMATYKFCDAFSATAGVLNGWDNVVDNNRGKSVQAAVTLTLGDIFTATASAMYGPEQNNDSRKDRFLLDIVATLTPVKWLTIGYNGDLAHEDDAAIGIRSGQDADWYGSALYAKVEFLEYFYVAARGEIFVDEDGSRLGVLGQTTWESTATLSCRPLKELEFRLEYRHDDSNRLVYSTRGGAGLSHHQNTVSLEVLFRF